MTRQERTVTDTEVDHVRGPGSDLARAPGGPDVAEVLLLAAAADGEDLRLLAAAHPGRSRADRWRSVLAASRTLDPRAADLSLIDLTGYAADARHGAHELVTRLARAPLGDLEQLDRFVRHQVLRSAWTAAGELAVQVVGSVLAADVVVDAAAAAFATDVLDHDLRRLMADPFRAARAAGALPGPVQSYGPLGVVLDAVAGWGPEQRVAWRRSVDLLDGGGARRAGAAADAVWVALLCERGRDLALLQLEAVVAFDRGGFSTRDAGLGCWDALDDVLTGLALADLLPDDAVDVLLRPWRAAGLPDPR
jgi:hypothetical protein